MYDKLSAMALAIGVCACAQVPASTTTQVPDKIKGNANESLAMVVAAKGVQIYECRASVGGQDAQWAFVAPEADLFDANGRKIGTHFAGPKWQSLDGSTIAGTLKARVDAPRADAIPWLLLKADSIGPAGAFSNITAVQRVNTVGGSAPASPCAVGDVGQLARVPYTADYYFLASTVDSAVPYTPPERARRETY